MSWGIRGPSQTEARPRYGLSLSISTIWTSCSHQDVHGLNASAHLGQSLELEILLAAFIFDKECHPNGSCIYCVRNAPIASNDNMVSLCPNIECRCSLDSMYHQGACCLCDSAHVGPLSGLEILLSAFISTRIATSMAAPYFLRELRNSAPILLRSRWVLPLITTPLYNLHLHHDVCSLYFSISLHVPCRLDAARLHLNYCLRISSTQFVI